MNYTELEKKVISRFGFFFNYRNAEDEISDNAGAFGADEIVKVTGIDSKVLRGVLSSLIKKGLINYGDYYDENDYFFVFTEFGINEYYRLNK